MPPPGPPIGSVPNKPPTRPVNASRPPAKPTSSKPAPPKPTSAKPPIPPAGRGGGGGATTTINVVQVTPPVKPVKPSASMPAGPPQQRASPMYPVHATQSYAAPPTASSYRMQGTVIELSNIDSTESSDDAPGAASQSGFFADQGRSYSGQSQVAFVKAGGSGVGGGAATSSHALGGGGGGGASFKLGSAKDAARERLEDVQEALKTRKGMAICGALLLLVLILVIVIAVTAGGGGGDGDEPTAASSNFAATGTPVDCQVAWERWGSCSKTCGGGTQLRRYEVKVYPKNGGKACPEQPWVQECRPEPCVAKVDCEMGLWEEWSKCSKSCEGGTRTRTRKVEVPAAGGGEACPETSMTRPCNSAACDAESVHCAMTEWSAYGACSRTCGGGSKTRTRTVVTEPKGNGDECDELEQSKRCSSNLCPVDCKVGAWSAWSGCSKSCGGGLRVRERDVLEAQVENGEECPVLTERDDCNRDACPVPQLPTDIDGGGTGGGVVDPDWEGDVLSLAEYKRISAFVFRNNSRIIDDSSQDDGGEFGPETVLDIDVKEDTYWKSDSPKDEYISLELDDYYTLLGVRITVPPGRAKDGVWYVGEAKEGPWEKVKNFRMPEDGGRYGTYYVDFKKTVVGRWFKLFFENSYSDGYIRITDVFMFGVKGTRHHKPPPLVDPDEDPNPGHYEPVLQSDEEIVIDWATTPVRPDETLMLNGHNLKTATHAQLCHGSGSALSKYKRCVKLDPVDASRASVKFVVPADFPLAVWAVMVCRESACSGAYLVNQAEAWWKRGDSSGMRSTAGGWLRVFGNSLGWDAEADECTGKTLRRGVGVEARLVHVTTGQVVDLDLDKADCYAATFDVPGSAPKGDYTVEVWNRLPLAWGAKRTTLGLHRITDDYPWRLKEYKVSAYGDSLQRALDAVRADGGGVVTLDAREYRMDDREWFSLPPRTILRGKGMDETTLKWPGKFDKAAEVLLQGEGSFRIEKLKVEVGEDVNTVISSAPGAYQVHVKQVHIKLERDNPDGMRSGIHIYDTVAYSITDCTIYHMGSCKKDFPAAAAILIENSRDGIVSGNTVDYSCWAYDFEGFSNLILEENRFDGQGEERSGGSTVSTYGNAFAENLYFARNDVQDSPGSKRTINAMFSLDGAGAAYQGKVKSVAGTTLFLRDDPQYDPETKTDWTGGLLVVLEGRGEGQSRRVTANSHRTWEMDRPFSVPLDSTSRITICPFRGHFALVGNRFTEGDNVQLYGSADHCVLADNYMEEATGMDAWGRNNGGRGYQANWHVDFLRNELIGCDQESASTDQTSDDVYRGPLARYHTHRWNELTRGKLAVEGTTQDVILEHNTVRDKLTLIEVGDNAEDVLTRKNDLDN